MNLNDFSKWLQYNSVKNLRGSEYFPYPLYIYIHMLFIFYLYSTPYTSILHILNHRH